MAVDGSETSNIERQSIGELLPDRSAPRKRHNANVVDRSFKQSATPVGTPENILGALAEAAGHIGTAAGTYMQQKVDEDKTVQAMRFYEGMAPSDDTTTAGYRTHAVLAMSNKVLDSTAILKKEAASFTGTDEEWQGRVRAAQTADHNAIMEKYPSLKHDPLASKSIVAMYGEQVPSIAATRISAKLAQEHEQRLNTFRDHIRVRVDGLKPEEADKVLMGVMDDSDTLQLTKGEREKELSSLAIERAEGGDLSMIEFTKRYNGGQKTSLWERSHAIQRAEESGKKVYWMKRQDEIATKKVALQERLNKGELTRDEFFAQAQGLNSEMAGLAYTDDSMIAAARKTEKETPWLNQAKYATKRTASLDELESGKFRGDKKGWFTRAGKDNESENAMVWTDEAMMAAWEKHERGTAEATDITQYTTEFFTQTVAGSVPLGQRGFDTKTNDAIIAAAKQVIEREGKREIAMLPAGSTPEQAQAIKDKYTAQYTQYLSASRLKDPEFVRLLSSFKLTDMSDAPNMKSLNPNTERALQLYTSMDEGARAEHMPDKADRAVFENFLSYVSQGHSRVAAMEKAIFAHRHPRNLTPDDLKAVKAKAKSAASESTSRYGSKWGLVPGAVWAGLASETAPDWYKRLHTEEFEKGTLANMLGGVVDAESAAKLYRDGFENTHTKLPNGMYVKGTLPVLADRMKVVQEDVATYFKTYLDMNKESLEDAGNVPISDMYFVTNPERGTFQIKTRLGDTLNAPAPLTDLKRGAGAFLDNKKSDYLKKIKDGVSDATGVLTLSRPETHIEDKENLVRTIALVEGNGGFDKNVGVFKPYRDGNGKQWNIGYGLSITDKEYNQDYIIRGGERYNLGRLKPSQITPNVAKSLMEDELARGDKEVRKYWKGYDELPAKYKGVLLSLHYNTGNVKPSNWPRLMEAMKNRDDEGVRREMITSYTTRGGDRVALTGRADTVYKRLFNK